MNLEEHDLLYWPPAREKAAEASPVLFAPPESSTELPYLVESITSVLPSWYAEAELSKVASEGAPLTLVNIWRHANAHPLVLVLILLDRYGQEVLEWLPETLKATLARDGISLSNSVWTKILAARVLLYSPSPWRQWEVFHWLALGLAGVPPNFTFLEKPEIGHLMVAVDLMKLVDSKRVFGEEIDKYVAAVFKAEGFPYAPPPLDFCQRELEQRKIECRSCQALHRDDNDTKCITCGSSDQIRIPYEFAELRDSCSSEWAKRSNKVLEQVLANLDENTAEGSVLSTLLVHWDYAKRIRGQMIEQFRMIGQSHGH